MTATVIGLNMCACLNILCVINWAVSCITNTRQRGDNNDVFASVAADTQLPSPFYSNQLISFIRTQRKTHTQTQTHNFPQPLHLPLQMPPLDLYLGRNSWRGGRRLRGAARTVCPAWRWHPGGTAAGWPAGPAQHSACPCAAWTGWFSHWKKTASWWWDGQRGEKDRRGQTWGQRSSTRLGYKKLLAAWPSQNLFFFFFFPPV